MRDNKAVVAMPTGMERQRINVADFARSQDLKQPPKLRRSLSRQTSTGSSHSKSPGRRRPSSSRDLVQEVYDRMGVKYVRGQSSNGIYDSSGSFSDNNNSKFSNSLSSSNVSRASAVVSRPALSVDTRNEVDERRDDRKSCRSSRSVKSLMSAFGGGKSVASAKSIVSRNSFQDFSSTTPSEGVGEKIIDVRDDGDMDGTMSVISVESHWTNRKQQQSFSSRSVVVQKSQTSMPKAAAPKFDGASLSDDAIDRIIEEKLQERLAELNASFEEKFRRLEEETNQRIEKLENQMKSSLGAKSKMTYPYQTYRL